MTNQKQATSPLTIAIAWIVVLAPAAWGVYYTVLGASKLFH